MYVRIDATDVVRPISCGLAETPTDLRKSPHIEGRQATKRSNKNRGTNKSFSSMCGTAGQTGLNIMNTTIKCPTQVSHFWDGGTLSARNLFLGQRDMGQHRDAVSDAFFDLLARSRV